MAAYSPRQRFALAIGAPILLSENRDPRELGGWDRTGVTRARGEDSLWYFGRDYLSQLGIATREDLVAWQQERVSSGRAADLARVVAVVGTAVWAQLLGDGEAWSMLLVVAEIAQREYDSWDAFGAACDAEMDVERARTIWAEVPWTTAIS